MEQEASVLRQDARLEAEDAEEEAALGRLRRLRMGQRLVQLRRGKLVRLHVCDTQGGCGGPSGHAVLGCAGCAWASAWLQLRRGKLVRGPGAPAHLRWARFVPGEGRLCLDAFSPTSPFGASVRTCESDGLHAACSEVLLHACSFICISSV